MRNLSENELNSFYKEKLKEYQFIFNKIIVLKTIFKKIEGNEIDLICRKFFNATKDDKFVSTYYFDIVLHDTDEKIGRIDARIGFNKDIFFGGHTGYFIEEKYRGNNYAVMAVRLLKKPFLEYGIKKIIITNNPDNHASIRVCEKLGAKLLYTLPLPIDNDQRNKGETEKNIWEYEFE